MKLYPDAAPVKGRWVVIKCDSGPGRLNTTLLAYLRYHGFILYPGVPNTTAVMQETDQSYGLFQSAVRTNLQLIIDERIAADKPKSRIRWRGSGNRVDCWVGFSAWVFPRADRQCMGKSWSSPTQPEVPLKPEGPPLNR